MKNNIKIFSDIDGQLVSNFTLEEFENPHGWVILRAETPRALEHVRDAFNARYHPDKIIVIVTDCTRTPDQNERLALRYGWSHQGGAVAKNSFHLVQYGGIAVDFVVYNSTRLVPIPPAEVKPVADLYFSYVQCYDDGHVHGDLRSLVLP